MLDRPTSTMVATMENDARPKLLIADDSRLIRVSARKILADRFELVEAEDGEEAWRQLQSDEDILALFTDLGMPQLDGYGLLERIRAAEDERIRDLPVVVVTGNEGEEARQEALDRGATDFVSKPFDKASLLARAQTHARLRKASTEARELQETATVDRLTGLGNQRAYVDALRQERAFALRHGQPMSLVLVELGDSERIVKELGSEAASSLIRAVGAALRKIIREEDTGARIATARYAVVAPACSAEGVERMGQRLMSAAGQARDAAGGTALSLRVVGYSPKMDKDLGLKQIVDSASSVLSGIDPDAGDKLVVHTDTPPPEAATEAPAAPEAPDATAAPPAASPLGVDEALAALARGDDGRVRAELNDLLKRVYPLLSLAGREAPSDLLSLISQATSRDD